MGTRSTVLITGADGYIGSQMMRRYLQSTDSHIIAGVRATDAEELANKTFMIQRQFAATGQRIDVTVCNLHENAPFARIDNKEIATIIHTAAITRFNVEEDLANEINRDGTRKVLEFAHTCDSLIRYAQISTIYSSGLLNGVNEEIPYSSDGPFANHYERSKCEAESILLNEYNDLPWIILRSATIISNDEAGNILQYNVFHNTLRLLFLGLTSIMPGVPTTPIYLITGQFVANAIFHLLNHQTLQQRIFNICYGRTQAIELGDLIDLVFNAFNLDETFRRRRILKPLFTNQEAFESLASVLDGMGGRIVRESLESIRPFSKQMFIDKEIRNTNLQEAWPSYAVPNIHVLLTQVVTKLLETRWGYATKIVNPTYH